MPPVNTEGRSVLVTGSTGYVGGRLVPRLLEAGYRVTVLVRDAGRIAGRPWRPEVTVIEGTLLDAERTWARHLPDDIDTAYYLVHAISADAGFRDTERAIADNFCRGLTGHAKVGHVIYLGGHHPVDGPVSEHLASRAETGERLARDFPTTEFRAGPVIGSGSASFEMLRYLTERLPVMVAPKWVSNTVDPIAVRDVLNYLVASAESEPSGVVEIGSGPMTFRDMMLAYAKVRGLSRHILPLPVLTPGLAARWVGLVTPIPNTLAIPIIKSMIAPIHADTRRARERFPDIRPTPFEVAVERALGKIHDQLVETRWTDALSGDTETVELTDEEGMIREVRSLHIDRPPSDCFRAFTALGGDTGWLTWRWAWRIRGAFDRMVGGPGLRRGRRHPSELLAGEALDFWRVERVEKDRELLLRAEMKVPGKAWLQFTVGPENDGARLVQTAYFLPSGLSGTLYWYLLYPVHRLIFSDLIRAVGRRAKAPAERAETEPSAG